MNRNRNTVRSIAFIAALAATGLASADHNSPWGEDWATDAMDVHDARFDSLNDDSVTGNDFLEDSLLSVGASFDTLPGTGGSMSGGGAASGGGRR
ncbi:MAG: hypothetical protein ACLGH6_07455 [Gammaproteobacteria bacterium]